MQSENKVKKMGMKQLFFFLLLKNLVKYKLLFQNTFFI